MAIKDILLPLVSYPMATETAAIRKSVAIAAHLGARISAVSFDLEVSLPAGPFTRAFVTDGDVVEMPEHQKSLANARTMMAALAAVADASGVSHDETIKRCPPDDIPAFLAGRSRTTDLSLVPVRPFDDVHQKIVQELIFESGRPILIFSEEKADQLPNSFDHIAIAWDHSKQAARAVADAMPLLKKAKTVRAFTVSAQDTAAQLEAGLALVQHLDHHGIKAMFEMVRKDGSSTGKLLEAYVRNNKSDLLVMGAYRHSRLAEFILGGATYTVVGQPPCWVMMSH
jgi:nucleotide-binding universal stress UspA family protein